MRNFIYTTLLTLALMVSNVQASTDEAKHFIEGIINSTVKVLKNNSSNDVDAKITKIFEQNVDINWMAKFALGRYKNIVEANEYQRYEQTYKAYLIASYLPNFRKYHNETVHINNVKTIAENEYVVETIIKRIEGEPIAIAYAIRKQGGKFLIFDIIAEGVSLITTQRADFNATMSDSHNSINTLISMLASKAR
jgi:phospholipid transport system substrate-binding protein